jgi:hypothetical protein
MTQGERDRVQGFKDNLRENGRFVKVDEDHRFKALIEDADIQDTSTILGLDLREKVRIHALRTDVPQSLLASDANSQVFVQLDDGTQLKIDERIDSPANPFVRFLAVKRTGVDA